MNKIEYNNGIEKEEFDKELDLVGAWPASSVQFNGKDLPYADPPARSSYSLDNDYWTYDPSSLTLSINVATPSPTSSVSTAKVFIHSFSLF